MRPNVGDGTKPKKNLLSLSKSNLITLLDEGLKWFHNMGVPNILLHNLVMLSFSSHIKNVLYFHAYNT